MQVREESSQVLGSSLFFCHNGCMTQPQKDLLSEIEESFRESFKGKGLKRLPSTAVLPEADARLDRLLLPDEERARMPFTKDAFLIKENPQLVQWERELRKFLRKLSPEHGHRVSAVMVYEWATGLNIAEMTKEEARRKDEGLEPHVQIPWRADLRKLNKLLREYFGKPYMTWIMGRKVPNAYRIPSGWYVYLHRPRTNTLYAEWASGVKL